MTTTVSKRSLGLRTSLQTLIDRTWYPVILDYLVEHDEEIFGRIKEEKKTHKVFPHYTDCFKAFKLTPFNKIKVVIIGQDPYHTPGVATGLAFGIKDGLEPSRKLAPSLINIEKAVRNNMCDITGRTDYAYRPFDYTLESWAKQGVLLLNTALTVNEKQPNSHAEIWKDFTNFVLSRLQIWPNIYLLWGKKAQAFEPLLTNGHNQIFKDVHPSPFNQDRFTKTECFKDVHDVLKLNRITPIKWM